MEMMLGLKKFQWGELHSSTGSVSVALGFNPFQDSLPLISSGRVLRHDGLKKSEMGIVIPNSGVSSRHGEGQIVS